MFLFTLIGFVTVVGLVVGALGIITGKIDVDLDIKVK